MGSLDRAGFAKMVAKAECQATSSESEKRFLGGAYNLAVHLFRREAEADECIHLCKSVVARMLSRPLDPGMVPVFSKCSGLLFNCHQRRDNMVEACDTVVSCMAFLLEQDCPFSEIKPWVERYVRARARLPSQSQEEMVVRIHAKMAKCRWQEVSESNLVLGYVLPV